MATPVKYIFERGITISLQPSGNWSVVAVAQDVIPFVSNLDEIVSRYNVRPIVEIQKCTDGSYRSWLIPPNRTEPLLEFTAYEAEKYVTKMPDHCHNLVSLSYTANAAIYHAKMLAKRYSIACEQFVELTRELQSAEPSRFFGEVEPYFEFDALVTALRRTYDATRYILSGYFRPSGAKMPRSFEECLDICTNMPDSLHDRLKTSWDNHGKQLTDYRHCIQHYFPIDFHQAGLTKLLDNKVWSISFMIPDNPEVRSKQKMEYSQQLDALTYGWELTSEVLTLAKEIVEAAHLSASHVTPSR